MGRGDIEAARIVGRFVVLRCAGKEGMRAVRDTVWEMCAGWVSRRRGRLRAGRWTAWSAAAGPARVRPAFAVRISFCPFAPAKRECGRCGIRCGRCAPDGFSAEGGACAPGDGRHGARRRGRRALLHAAVKQAARIGEIRRRPRLERGEDTVAQGGRFHRKGQRIVFQAAKLVQPVAHIDRQRVVQP